MALHLEALRFSSSVIVLLRKSLSVQVFSIHSMTPILSQQDNQRIRSGFFLGGAEPKLKQQLLGLTELTFI